MLTRAANAQARILSLRTVRAGALAAVMPLRNVPPETVPGRMRAVATKLADWHRPQSARAAPGLTLPMIAACAQVRSRYGCEAAAVAWSGRESALVRYCVSALVWSFETANRANVIERGGFFWLYSRND